MTTTYNYITMYLCKLYFKKPPQVPRLRSGVVKRKNWTVVILFIYGYKKPG